MMASEEVSPKVSPASSPLHSSPLPLPGDEEHQCAICSEKLKHPKVLSCLHVFCQECLEKQLNENKKEESTQSVSPPPEVIKCPTCEQETRLSYKGVADFPTEHIISDMLDMSVIEDMQIVCTSCKAKEKAVARCTDCANFLCPNCVTAHQFMRCFENHKVVSFEDMQNGDSVKMHKPILCDQHPTENLKYYCNTCQVPICNECMIAEHRQPEHMHEKVEEVEDEVKEELKTLISECKSKISFCQEATTMLENALSDLQTQRDNAKGLIQETFQSYKAILEKKKDDILDELEETHSHQELTIMEMFHDVGKTVEKMEDGCDFTSYVLDNGNSLQIVLLKKIISTQLLSLINNTPKPDVAINIEFKSNSNIFTEAVGKTFGSLVKEDTKIEANMSSLHSSFENDVFTLPHGVLSPGHPILPPVHLPEFLSTMRAITPVSINGNIGNIGSLVSMPPPCSIASSIAANLPPLPEGSNLSNNSHSPVNSDSGISVDAGSTGSSQGNTMMNMNIAALAKLGAVGFNSQGQVTLNGQVVQGLNLSNIPPPISSAPNSRTTTPNMLQQESGLTSMLNVNTSTARNQNPNLESLANLFGSQATPPMNGVGNPLLGMGTFGNLNNLDSIGSLDTMISPSDSEISTFDPSSVNQPFPPVRRANKMSAMQIRCKFGQLGPGKGQFNSPHGFCLGLDEDIIVADTNNHRIQVFEKTGEFKYQFGIPGREEGQLWYPRKVAVMRSSGKFVVCDRGNERSRMQIFTKNGHFIKKIAIRYIDIVAGLAITQQGHVVAVDSVSPTVFCIAETGDLIKWFDCSDYMREPSDIAVSGKEYFVCDFKGHCVVVFNEDGQFARRIGCENITNYPNGIDISDAGDVLIGDSHGNRFHVAVFQRDGSLIGEFQCPYVKVSRCCGLKITSEGYIVTLAKNNHHVLVLNTLYIT